MMRTTARTPSVTVDRKALVLVAAVTVVIVTATLIVSDIGEKSADTAPVHVQTMSPAHRPTDRGVGVPRQPSLSRSGSGTENLEANGLPIAPVVAQDHHAADGTELPDDTTWTAFQGHEELTSR